MFYHFQERRLEEHLVVPLRASYSSYSIVLQEMLSTLVDYGIIYIAQRVMTSSLTYLDFSHVLKDLFDDDGNYFWSSWYEGLLSEEGDLMSAMHGRMFDLIDDYASYGAQALMNLWESQGEEILSRFPMLSEYGGEDTQRATLLGLLNESRHREVMSEVLNHWQMTNPYAHEQWMFGVSGSLGAGGFTAEGEGSIGFMQIGMVILVALRLLRGDGALNHLALQHRFH